MVRSEAGKGAKRTKELINQFIDDICEVLGEEKNKKRMKAAVVNAVFANMEQMPEDLERKKRLERHVHVLQVTHRTIADGDDWERLHEIDAAIVAGGMALQRTLREDYPEEDAEK